MKTSSLVLALLSIASTAAYAQPKPAPACEIAWLNDGPRGQYIEQVRCGPGSAGNSCNQDPRLRPICDRDDGSGRTTQQLRLNGKHVIYSTTNSRTNFHRVYTNSPSGVSIYTLGDVTELSCESRLLLVDLRDPQPKAFEFGISQRCAEPSQAFWSKKKGVEKGTLIVKPDVKFIYTGGRLIPPDDPAAADGVTYTSDLLLEEAKKLGYPGAYVREIPLK